MVIFFVNSSLKAEEIFLHPSFYYGIQHAFFLILHPLFLSHNEKLSRSVAIGWTALYCLIQFSWQRHILQ